MKEFEQFSEAMISAENDSENAGNRDSRPERITVLGGNGDALMIAALCLAEGANVTLFSAYDEEMDVLQKGPGISIRGTGPIGNYAVDREDSISIKTTSRIDSAVAGSQLIFLTGPTHKQRIYAMALARFIKDGQTLVILPARTFGVMELAWLLKIGGAKADCTLIEVLGLPYWYTLKNSSLNLTQAAPMAASALPAKRNKGLGYLRRFLPNLIFAESAVHSSFYDGSGLIEIPALLLGGMAIEKGIPELPAEAEPLPENETFMSLIGKDHLAVIRQMAEERIKVGHRFGIRKMPTAEDWLETFAGTIRGEGGRPIPSAEEAKNVIRCAATGSLIPLVSAARKVNVSTPVTQAMISLINSMLGVDISLAGRKLEAIGIDLDDTEDIQKKIFSIV